MRNPGKQKGVTFLELMVVIAILGVLSAIAIPQYGSYTKRSKFAHVMAITAPIKFAVQVCYSQTNGFSTCNGSGAASDFGDIPLDIPAPGFSVVESVVTSNGEITVQANSELDSVTYTLTPSLVGKQFTWNVGGTCLAAGYCR